MTGLFICATITRRSGGWASEGDKIGVDAQIKCRNIEKVLGADPEGFMQRQKGNPTADDLAAEGYIGAVSDV
mgnify:CR=1 FL=1